MDECERGNAARAAAADTLTTVPTILYHPQVIKDHLENRVDQGVSRAPNERLLGELEALWGDHKRDMRRISEILMYMVRGRAGWGGAVRACGRCARA